MERSQAAAQVESINQFLARQPLMDFEVASYEGQVLRIRGSIDPSSSRDIEIWFERIHSISMPMERHTDTSSPPLSLLDGDEAREHNLRFRVERGHFVFRFAPEDYPNDFGCIVAAQSIGHSLGIDC